MKMQISEEALKTHDRGVPENVGPSGKINRCWANFLLRPIPELTFPS